MQTLEHPSDPITEYFLPSNTARRMWTIGARHKSDQASRSDEVIRRFYEVQALLREFEAANQINNEALEMRLMELQRLLDENKKIMSSTLSPIKALFIDLFVQTGIFALIAAVAVALVHYFYNASFFTQLAGGHTFLQVTITIIIVLNLILLLVSTAKSVIRTLVTV